MLEISDTATTAAVWSEMLCGRSEFFSAVAAKKPNRVFGFGLAHGFNGNQMPEPFAH
jgi:hypothetical protein